jgi:uncharacterized protein (TIGR03437 family)
MNRRSIVLLLTLIGLPAMPALAQTVIGGGTCSSATLSGTFEFLLNGRQLTSTGATAQLLQSVGTATFDGLSKVTFNLTANTVTTTQSFGTAVTYSGTYSLQANCLGTINITSGDTATFTLEAYTQPVHTTAASAFAVVGSDASYAFSGNGSSQPATCPTTISGAHEFNGTGAGLTGASVNSTLDVTGILQFAAGGTLTASWTQVSNLTSTQVSATGTYTAGTNCLASATLTDTANNKYTLSMSFNSTSPAFALAVSSPTLVFDGSGSAMQLAAITSCNTAMLNGTYYINLNGRVSPGGIVSKIMLADGAATFNGTGKVTLNLTSDSVNGSQVFGAPLTYSGSYSLSSTCQGSIGITTGDTATFAIVAYNFDATTPLAKSFTLVGTDATFAFTGGGSIQPAACATATLSGVWPFSGTGNSLSGAAITGLQDLAGVLQFDGQGNVTASWNEYSNTASPSFTATGTYSVTAACLGTISLTDQSSNTYTGAISMFGVDEYGYANNFELIATSPQLIFTGAGRAAFYNPAEALDNNSDFLPSATPGGSVFSLFGSNLATKTSQPSNIPLLTTVLTTSVSVNGELAPLFYVSGDDVVGEMPEDIKPGLATVFVKNGSSTSNAVAVIIPEASPQIGVYGNNLAVVTFTDYSTVTATNPAKVGDNVVAWFTGGGPVNASGKLTSGAESPSGLSPVSGPYTITLGGVDATAGSYVGLSPGSIGLYQANFVVPNVSAGSHPLVITISNQASNAPVMSVK